MGGCGIRSLLSVAPAAYFGAVAIASPFILNTTNLFIHAPSEGASSIAHSLLHIVVIIVIFITILTIITITFINPTCFDFTVFSTHFSSPLRLYHQS